MTVWKPFLYTAVRDSNLHYADFNDKADMHTKAFKKIKKHEYEVIPASVASIYSAVC